MLELIEKISLEHEHSIALLEAISTFAAVVISLTLALMTRAANKTHLKAYVSIRRMVHATIDNENPPRYLIACITNTGLMPLRIPLSFFHWKAPLHRGTWSILPHDYSAEDPLVPQQKYPVEIPPKATHSFFLSNLGTLQQNLGRMLCDEGKISKLQLFFIRAKIISDDGLWFTVSIDNGVRAEIKKACHPS